MKYLAAALLLFSMVTSAVAAEPATEIAAPDAVAAPYAVPIGRTEHRPLVVTESGRVVGQHPYRSIVVGRIESEGLEAKDGVIGITLGDFTLDGDGDTTRHPQKNRADREAYPSGEPGIHVKSWGIRVDDVSVANVAGTGLVYERGPAPPARWDEFGCQPESRLSDLYIARCYDGAEIGGSDVMLSRLVVSACRGDGVVIKAPSAALDTAHVYGADRGIVFASGKQVATNILAENCREGIVCDGRALQVQNASVWRNFKVGVRVRQHADFHGRVEAGGDSTAAIVESSAIGSRLDLDLALGDEATGVELSADQTTLSIWRNWGGRRVVVIDRPVDDCQLDVCVNGSQVGVEILQLGHRNRINITARNCAAPVVLPKGGVHASNVITVNGKPYRGR